MVRFMDRNPHAGATGCKLLNEDGTVQNSVRRFLTFRMALYNNTILGRVSCFKKLSGDYKMRGFSFSRVEEVDAAGGAALMIKRTVLDEVGLLDEGYFIFMEEMDLCRRIRARGHQIYYFPDAVITHLGGKSRRQNPKGMILIIQKSLIWYFTKFEGARRTSHFKIFYKPLFLAEIVYGLFINVLYLAKYRTVRKNAEKARRKWVKIEESIYFLGKELGSFFFRI
jgi:GT2 family glycosyltransferase